MASGHCVSTNCFVFRGVLTALTGGAEGAPNSTGSLPHPKFSVRVFSPCCVKILGQHVMSAGAQLKHSLSPHLNRQLCPLAHRARRQSTGGLLWQERSPWAEAASFRTTPLAPPSPRCNFRPDTCIIQEGRPYRLHAHSVCHGVSQELGGR